MTAKYVGRRASFPNVSHKCCKESVPHSTYLALDMPEIDPQFLQERRLPLIPFRPKRRDPPRPQPALLPHAPADGALPAEPRGGPEPATGARVRLRRGRRLAVAVRGLGGGGVTRDGGGVAGLVELEVLRVVGLLLLLRVVLGHGGQRVGV